MAKATATGKSLSISSKYTFMICQYLRGRKVARAKTILEAAIAGKEAIPFTKFNDGVGHRRGIAASGRYPKKACEAVLGLIKSAEANATNAGLTGELTITELRANRASTPMRAGRQSRRSGKRTHVHVAVEELAARKITKETKISTQATEAKPAAKPAESAPKKTPKKTAAQSQPAVEKKAEAAHGN